MSLANATQKKQASNLPCIIAELVGYKQSEDGRDAMIVKVLNEKLQPGEIFTVTQGKAPTEELEVKRRSISSFSNINSKHHLKPGAIVRLDQVKLNSEAKTAEAIFIKDMYTGESDDARSIIIGMSRPLPSRANKENAWLEIIDPAMKKTANTPKEFGQALAEAFRDSMLFTKGNGIAEFSKNVIILTDNNNSRPYTIFIRNVQVNPEGQPPQYRYPTVTDLFKQFESDETVKAVNTLLDKSGGKFSINVIPGARILVASTLSKDSKYEHVIKNHTGKFKIDAGEDGIVEAELIGYKKVAIGLWNGVVNNIAPLEYTRPQLNEQPESLAIQAPGKMNSSSLSHEKSKLEESSNAAANAMAALSASNSATENQNEKANNSNSYEMPADVIQKEMETKNVEIQQESDIDNFFNFDESDDSLVSATNTVDSDQDYEAASIFSSMNSNY